jgi:hypothetical protein
MKKIRWLIGRINKECHPERSPAPGWYRAKRRVFRDSSPAKGGVRMTMGVFCDFEIDEEKGIAFRKEV